MDPVTAVLGFYLLVFALSMKNAAVDAKAYAAGKTPERFKRTQRLFDLAERGLDRRGSSKNGQASTHGTPKRRGAAANYMWHLWDDAWHEATRRHEAKHQVTDPARAERYRHRLIDRQAKIDKRREQRQHKREQRRTERQQRRQERDTVRDRYSRSQGEVSDTVDPYASDTSAAATSGAIDDGAAAAPGPEQAATAPVSPTETSSSDSEAPATPDPSVEAEDTSACTPAGDAGDADVAVDQQNTSTTNAATSKASAGGDDQLASVHPIGGGDQVSTVPQYESGLDAAIGYCAAQQQARAEDVASVETTVANMQGAGYGDSVIGPLETAKEALAGAVAAFESATRQLEQYKKVQEDYEATPDAPDKQELLANR